jgi:hypothetical protein
MGARRPWPSADGGVVVNRSDIIAPCCNAWGKSEESGTDNEGYAALRWDLDGEWHFGLDLPPVKFCPWCGAPKGAA